MFTSALAIYYVSSDHSGYGGMHYNIIWCTPQWQGGSAQYNCIFVDNDSLDDDSLSGLLVTHVLLFFLFKIQGHLHSCALVEWFIPFSDEPDALTEIWIVMPKVNTTGCYIWVVISVKSILQGIHLIGVFGAAFLPITFHFSHSLNTFNTYYVNRYIDYHLYTNC